MEKCYGYLTVLLLFHQKLLSLCEGYKIPIGSNQGRKLASFPPHVSLRQRYALLGNSLSVTVVAPLLQYLFTER
ncbi:hypothetical protein CRG98_014163 [Punica granatum]|uniref:Uncharacterized protein n=1 Tax=Punica granatum TaxID=22663 RepID=A0A2I0KA80_PUNGR|nr:hypothetical protein CRG98_014163 [Punica granatum]